MHQPTLIDAAVLVLIPIVIIGVSCESPTGGTTTGPLTPTSLVWSIDTISIPGESFSADHVWTGDRNTIYLAGWSSGSVNYTMLRRTGASWSTTGYHIREGGPISGAVTFFAIYGFSPNDVWAVGARSHLVDSKVVDSSIVLRYNGTTWQELPTSSLSALSVWGSSQNDVWVGTRGGTIYRYYGGVWSSSSSPRSADVYSIAGFGPNNTYATSLSPRNGDYTYTHYFMHWDGVHWTVVDSATAIIGEQMHFGSNGLTTVGSSLYSIGPAVYRYSGNIWTEIAGQSGVWLTSMTPISDDQFVAVGTEGVVCRYSDGSLANIEPFRNSSFFYRSVAFADSMIVAVGRTIEGSILVTRGTYN